jgi:hypothetical protein
MNFLKVGDTLINLDRIARINLSDEFSDEQGQVYKGVTFGEAACDVGDITDFRFMGTEAEAIRSLLRGESGRFIRDGVWEVEIPRVAGASPDPP